MKRLHLANLFGVLILAAVCVAQWLHDRQLNLEFNRVEKARLDQAAQMAEQEQTARGLTTDLAQLKASLGKTQMELDDIRGKLRSAEGDLRQLAAERDQLRSSITNWAAAVAARDERLQEANTRIGKLADELDGSVRRFNDLATNHNAMVKELNELRARVTKLPSSAPPP
jgi:chromosome segregation ATPase